MCPGIDDRNRMGYRLCYKMGKSKEQIGMKMEGHGLGLRNEHSAFPQVLKGYFPVRMNKTQ
jgi:hypothetical protein